MENHAKFTIDLEFLGLKDAEKAPSAVKAVATAVADLTDLINPLKGIQDQLAGISTKLDNVGKAGQKAGEEVKKSFFQSIGDSAFRFNNILSAAQTVAGKIAPIFQEGMARQNAEVQFSTLLGKKEDGIAYATELRNSTMATLYGNNTVNDAAKNMLAFGLDKDTITPVLESIGDIAAGDAQKFGSLSLAFAQISSAGKLGGQDLMQLINAGFNPLQEISRKTGKTIGELKEEMSKGAISAKDVEEAFKSATAAGGMFYGMAEDIKKNTLGGQLAVMAASFDDLKAKVFDALLPVVQKITPIITDQILPALMSLAEYLTPIGEFIADNLDAFGILGGAILSIVTAVELWSAAQSVLNVIMSANPVGLIVIGIVALITLVTIVIKKYEDWGAALTLVMGPLGLIINLIMSFKRHWDSIVEAFADGGILAGLKRIGLVLLDSLLMPVQQLLEILAKIPGLSDLAGKGASFIDTLRGNLDLKEADKKPEKKEEESALGDPMGDVYGVVNEQEGKGNGGASLDNAAKTGTDKVAGGGQRNTTINITLSNLVETINFNGSIDENSEDLTSKTQNALLRVLYSAQTAI